MNKSKGGRQAALFISSAERAEKRRVGRLIFLYKLYRKPNRTQRSAILAANLQRIETECKQNANRMQTAQNEASVFVYFAKFSETA